MRKLLSAALAALTAITLAVAAPLAPAFAADRPDTVAKVVTLLSSATRTATATGSWVATGVQTLPIGAITFGVSRHALVFQTVGTVSGTTPTLDLTIEGSLDGGTTAFTLSPLTGTASAAWSQVTASTSKQVRRYEGPLPPLIRAVATIGGTSPSFGTHAVTAVLGG